MLGSTCISAAWLEGVKLLSESALRGWKGVCETDREYHT